VLVDGASTDGTLELLRAYREQALRSGRVVMLESAADQGIYDAMNKGLARASGAVVGLLNADDFYADERALERVAELFADPQIEACYGDLAFIRAGAAGQPPADLLPGGALALPDESIVRYWRAGAYHPRAFYQGWMPPHPTFFVRREVYERLGRFRLDMGSAADYEIMLRFIVRNQIRCAYLPEVLVKMRLGGISTASLRNRMRANRMDRKAWAVNGLKPYPWTLWLKPLRKLAQWVDRPA
jgi:glycosyltransferase